MHEQRGALQDLNDLYFFAAVAENGGFSAAGRALGVPKSRLSKRVAQLEERLGVRLLQRTTRRFVVTEVGERFLGHCRAVLEEAQAAQDAVDELRAEPHGVVRISCPTSLAQTMLAELLPDFLRATFFSRSAAERRGESVWFSASVKSVACMAMISSGKVALH